MPIPDVGSAKTIDAANAMGLQYMVVVFATLRAFSGPDAPRLGFAQMNAEYEKITLDDFKWNAEQFNQLGARVKNAGMRLAYHNHALDLKTLTGGVSGLDALISGTDPSLVGFQMDTGHVIHAGADPIAYLRKYPGRFEMLHLKDLKAGYSVSTALDTENKDTNATIGAGVIDWKQLFGVSTPGQVKHFFVEHEGAMAQPPMDSIRTTFNYLKQL
jgi:sugar phosphate isomerase/epimerase